MLISNRKLKAKRWRAKFLPWQVLALTLCSVATASTAPQEKQQAPPHAVLLFVASWCAPCYGEVRALRAISKAAFPMRVIVVPIDKRRTTERMVANVPAHQLMRLDPPAALALMRRTSGGAAGLPTTVATDAEGQTCAVVHRPLEPAVATSFRARCGSLAR